MKDLQGPIQEWKCDLSPWIENLICVTNDQSNLGMFVDIAKYILLTVTRMRHGDQLW